MEISILVLALVFIVWGALSTAFQFDHPRMRRLSYRDCFGLLPLWTFFAPSPGQTDYHLVYRDQTEDGSTTDLCEISLGERRSACSWLWNPEKRGRKVLSDIVQMLLEISSAEGTKPSVLLLSTPYTLVLHAVMAEPLSPGAVRRQFVIAQTRGFFRDGPPEVLLRSSFHRVSS
jgi:hypothetical protein